MSTEDDGYKIALQEAILGAAEGGIPVGACVVSKDGKVLGRGRNTRMQNGSVIHHASTSAFEGERLYPRAAYKNATLYTTLSPCWMCAGAALWFRVRRVVIGGDTSDSGPEEVLRREGVEVVRLGTRECGKLMERWRGRAPEMWEEEMGR